MKSQFSRISVIGLGYIGLPTAAVIALRGYEVVGVDVSQKAVDAISRGYIHIIEPELDIAVRSAVSSGRLRAVMQSEEADAFLVTVPTPFDENHQPDLSYIKAAVESIAPVLKKGNLVVLESTSPVGTTEKMVEWLSAARPDLAFPSMGGESADVFVAYCPERVLPGQVLRELVENDRIIGGLTAACTEKAKALYRIFVQGKLLETDARTAEMAKLTENAFRDVNIAFANELSLICDKTNISVWKLIELANHHPRVNILQPGAGVGGHCIAVDPWFIVASSPQESRLIRCAREVNDGKPEFVINKTLQRIGGKKNPVVACLGLAFKPNVGDLRESPALQIVRELAGRLDGEMLAVEPHIDELPESLPHHGNVRLVEIEEALQRADLVIGLVRHTAFVENESLQSIEARRMIDFVNIIG